ncbi:hypothetical protein K461DRAFT_295517 [Myriangium duriaei CBS 260.36]|uniref:Uncharacterized protein n=1 Tax=Myriangium duriaei CBS 260.36 TaxID=1168546 RepID=A0A9P4MFU8_9PEZI|nr:hypothetical protein K461DRAFT_295517 [Myriangium duriaei CBS 260.36]
MAPPPSANAPSLVLRAAIASKTPWEACKGCRNPGSFNNAGIFVLFALLGLGMVCGSLWFFFHARNGGFVYHEGDWEDYKSTVLRKKGPDGKTIVSSRATTRWGGTEKMSADEEKNRWAAMSVVAKDDKGRKGILAKRGWGGTHAYTYADDFTNYDGNRAMTEASPSVAGWMPPQDKKKKTKTKSKANPQPVPGAWDIDLEANRGHHNKRYKDRDVASYAKERSARVGGMNRSADGSHFDPSGSEISSNSGHGDPRHHRAEKKALDDAERMERQWRREAQRAAASLAKEDRSATSSPTKKQGLQRGGAGSRTPSPQKRRAAASGNYSFSQPSEGSREPKTSYYDAYRPRK